MMDAHTSTLFMFLLLLISVGLTASSFGMGATLSNFLGQLVVQHFGHVASLMGSLLLSIVPIVLFSTMPETYGHRCDQRANNARRSGSDANKDNLNASSSSPQQQPSYQSIAV